MSIRITWLARTGYFKTDLDLHTAQNLATLASTATASFRMVTVMAGKSHSDLFEVVLHTVKWDDLTALMEGIGADEAANAIARID